MEALEILGYIAGFLLAICGAPQAVQSYKQGDSKGVSLQFLWLWMIGELGMTAYTLLKIGFDGPLMLNYTFNIVVISFIMRYYYFPRRTS